MSFAWGQNHEQFWHSAKPPEMGQVWGYLLWMRKSSLEVTEAHCPDLQHRMGHSCGSSVFCFILSPRNWKLAVAKGQIRKPWRTQLLWDRRTQCPGLRVRNQRSGWATFAEWHSFFSFLSVKQVQEYMGLTGTENNIGCAQACHSHQYHWPLAW